MGYTIDPDQFRLVFADERLARPASGDPLEVTLEELSIGELLDFDAMRLREVSTTDEVRERHREVAEFLAAHLVSWNLERKGEPVPLNAAGVSKVPQRVLSAIVTAWVQANIGISGPLETGSPSGGPSLEASMPMDVLSPNPEN